MMVRKTGMPNAITANSRAQQEECFAYADRPSLISSAPTFAEAISLASQHAWAEFGNVVSSKRFIPTPVLHRVGNGTRGATARATLPSRVDVTVFCNEAADV
jgi:hypothetical protein